VSPARTVADLRPRARALHDLVVRQSSDLRERLALVHTLAYKVGALERDTKAVAEVLLGGVVRECSQ
jgi:hypothetical protein